MPRRETFKTAAKRQLENLRAEGETFTYENFADHDGPSKYNWVVHFQPAWIAWRTQLDRFIRSTFEDDSTPVVLLGRAQSVELYKFGRDQFDKARALYSEAMSRAGQALEDDLFNELRE